MTQNEVDTPRNPASILPYNSSHVGIAEWSSGGPGERNQASPAWIDGEPGYTGYRKINGAPNTALVATILLMGVMFIGKKHKLTRLEGIIFLTIYAVYILYVVNRG